MKFVINKILLWLENGTCRTVKFEKNKVNVITGDSGTGKSAILDIIDYCFFSSTTEIPDEVINENVMWYGINFDINDKNFTIARSRFHTIKKLSKEYFFSGLGVIPELPYPNISEKECKLTIEKEFSIDKNVVIPYSGNNLRAGSKISLRYFFMFNTQSEDIITNKQVFFDKQNDEKYREALERIFDIATGIETVENILILEKIKDTEKEINRIEKKKTLLENQSSLYEENQADLIKKAREYGLISGDIIDFKTELKKLKEVVLNYKEESMVTEPDNILALRNEKNDILRKMRAYKKFKKQYEEYRKVEGNNYESLKPVMYIKENFYEVIEVPEIKGLLLDFEQELLDIKNTLDKKHPINLDIDSEISKLEEKLVPINTMLNLVPEEENTFSNKIDKYIFIGELRHQLSFFDREIVFDGNYEEQILDKQEELEELLSLLDDNSNKETIIKLLEELIDGYLDQSKDALGTYAGYKALFDYKKKQLKLRKPGTANPSTVGSSSNHMFLHLCLFLALHELIIKQKSPYVPPFLILDQPSRPYYGEDSGGMSQKQWEEVNTGDKKKINIAMKVMNDFVEYVNTELKRDFQIIILEHIPKSIWEDAKLNSFHLVEEFKEGENALINI
ncbi:DUF3732 domain-containing protein [Planococcus sp. 107-1]|uniref:DUF3732 domain-containing protein n=1 Tax=Planococcus sp. 107-1 TaxID=2908840 RepID=UPI001F3A697A|nr:DUF3732 domain-containing protein [Planococcus sp. 107-1]UJF27561.1 DUF3732 domain-containing protein [Planococcus sp. 107-1]